MARRICPGAEPPEPPRTRLAFATHFPGAHPGTSPALRTHFPLSSLLADGGWWRLKTAPSGVPGWGGVKDCTTRAGPAGGGDLADGVLPGARLPLPAPPSAPRRSAFSHRRPDAAHVVH